MRCVTLMIQALCLTACATDAAIGSGDRVEAWIAVAGQARMVKLEDAGNHYRWEGDIILAPDQVLLASELDNDGDLTTSFAVAATDTLWPDGVVPVEISPDFSTSMVGKIRASMAAWHRATKIRFVDRTDQRDYVAVVPTDAGCRSSFGRVGGRQLIELGVYCQGPTIIHEFGHALGLGHEHSRAGRDQYVLFDPSLATGIQLSAIGSINPWDWRVLTPYDPASVMHYPSNGDGCESCLLLRSPVEAWDAGVAGPAPWHMITFGGISHLDLAGIEQLYGAPTFRGRVNLAAFATATASSAEPSQEPQRAADGWFDSYRQWVSGGVQLDGSADVEPFVVFDLGDEALIERAVIYLASAAGQPKELNARSVFVDVFEDGSWHEAQRIDNPQQATVVDTPLWQTARFVRIRVADPGDDRKARIVEVELLGNPRAVDHLIESVSTSTGASELPWSAPAGQEPPWVEIAFKRPVSLSSVVLHEGASHPGAIRVDIDHSQLPDGPMWDLAAAEIDGPNQGQRIIELRQRPHFSLLPVGGVFISSLEPASNRVRITFLEPGNLDGSTDVSGVSLFGVEQRNVR